MSTSSDAPPTSQKLLRCPQVMIPAAVIVLGFVAVASIAPTWLKSVLSTANTTVIDGIGWYYVLIVAAFVVFSLAVAFSRYGSIRLGRDTDTPTYSLPSWFAMLFAAGMGIGLVFWGVAEPLNHMASPPPGTNTDTAEEVARNAFQTTFLHWGLHAWAIYIVIGLAIALAVHRRGRSVSMRWILEPLLGDRVKGWVGHTIDVVAIVGTIFGVATSLGFGVTQFTAGLEHLGFLESSTGWLVLFVILITALATASVVSGLDVGIKFLSLGNLILAGVLMVLVMLLGDPLFVLRQLVQTTGDYVQNIVHLSLRTMPFEGEDGAKWMGAWTTYYWGWWMSWSPFVGVFIARISKGRTVREFVLGVMAVPTLLTFSWFAIMGGTAVWQQLTGQRQHIGEDGAVSTNNALFDMLDALPGGALLSGCFLILIVVFFITSSDSASFVVDMLASGGDPNPPVATRVFWAVMEGTIAAVLLWVGSLHGGDNAGLAALQTMSILAAAPLSVVMVLTVISTLMTLRREHHARRASASDDAEHATKPAAT